MTPFILNVREQGEKNKWIKWEKDKYHMISAIHAINQNKWTKNKRHKGKNRDGYKDGTNWWLQRGGGGMGEPGKGIKNTFIMWALSNV